MTTRTCTAENACSRLHCMLLRLCPMRMLQAALDVAMLQDMASVA